LANTVVTADDVSGASAADEEAPGDGEEISDRLAAAGEATVSTGDRPVRSEVGLLLEVPSPAAHEAITRTQLTAH
jgi:hypothetical protein